MQRHTRRFPLPSQSETDAAHRISASSSAPSLLEEEQARALRKTNTSRIIDIEYDSDEHEPLPLSSPSTTTTSPSLRNHHRQQRHARLLLTASDHDRHNNSTTNASSPLPQPSSASASASASANAARLQAPPSSHLFPQRAVTTAPIGLRASSAAASSSSSLPVRGSVSQSHQSAHALRTTIRAIDEDVSLSDADRNRRRQQLYSGHFTARAASLSAARLARMQANARVPSYSTVEDESAPGRKMLGCEHYPRKCKLRAACCNAWVVCRHCHDAVADHEMDRFATREVLCMNCWSVQGVSEKCAKCGIQFAKYFCAECRFYDDTPDKDIYHCDKCRICRVGKGLGRDNYHCDKCDACVSLDTSENHKCLKKSLDANCPICSGYLFTSTQPVVFMRCGHGMHSSCFDTYIAYNYVCPLCSKTLTDMQPYYQQIDEAVAEETLPEDLRKRRLEVLCHDCDCRSITPFHYDYLKCQKCSGYNTRRIREATPEEKPRALPD